MGFRVKGLGPKIQLRPRRAPRAFATFRLTTIYLPQCLLFKWVVVKYSGVPLPVAGGDTHRSKFSLFDSKPEFWKRLAWKLVSVPCDPATFVSLQICQHRARRRRSHTFLGGISHNCPFGYANCEFVSHSPRAGLAHAENSTCGRRGDALGWQRPARKKHATHTHSVMSIPIPSSKTPLSRLCVVQ